MHPGNTRAVIDGLLAYGEAARNNDMDLDGKTIQADMETLADILNSDTLHTTEAVLDKLMIEYTNGTYNWA